MLGRQSLDNDTGLEKGVDVSALDEYKLFDNIRILETRIMGSKGDHYISYRIVYDGLFEVVEIVASSKKTASCLMHQEVFVWKRFSEFISFHQKLESNPMLRPHIKKLENPSKMKTVHSIIGGASKLGAAVTSQRVRFLLKYLKTIINLPIVCSSLELRAFLDYDSTGQTKPGPSTTSGPLTTLRLERLVSQGVREAVNLLKNVFPIDSYQEGGLATLFSSGSSSNVRQKIDTLYGAESLLTDCLVTFKSSKHFHDLFCRSTSGMNTPLTSSQDNNWFQKESSRLKWSRSCDDLRQVSQDLLPHPLVSGNQWESRLPSSQSKSSLSESIFNFLDCVTHQSLEPSLHSFLIKLFLEDYLET